MTTEKKFAKFVEENPQYKEWGNAYLETVTYEDGIMLVQHSFCVSSIRDIKKLIKIGRPALIYYGTQDLGRMCKTQLPKDLHSIIHPHGWYEGDVCVIVKRVVCEHWKAAKEAQDAQRQ